MTTQAIPFQPESHLKALFDHIYEIKFSKHVPLVMVLLFAVFAVWRTNSYISTTMGVDWYISGSLAVCIELLLLASGAACFMTMRAAYIRELKQEDAERAKFGVWCAYAMTILASVVLVGIAGADGAKESSGNLAFIFIMIVLQLCQSCIIGVFINIADLEERDKLRLAHEAHKRALTRQSVNECPYCHCQVSLHNRKRHIKGCIVRNN